MKRIGVLTSGGDSPGMNAAIRCIVRYANFKGLEVLGIERGYSGLIEGNTKVYANRAVSNIINKGGTILKTGRCPEFETKEGRKKAAQTVKGNRIDGLIVIGGNGSYRGAYEFHKESGVPVVCLPGTIDNDIVGTDSTIGSDTAVNTALDAIDKIRDTATSLERIFVIEVMGRMSGFIAMQVAVGGGAEELVVPGKSYDIEKMCADIVEGHKKGKMSWIIIVAEGAASGADVAKRISERTGLETRVAILGHIQRGGSPTADDRYLATRLGAHAVDILLQGEGAKAVGVVNGQVNVVGLDTAFQKKSDFDEELYNLIKILSL